jgi:hypothetical protein
MVYKQYIIHAPLPHQLTNNTLSESEEKLSIIVVLDTSSYIIIKHSVHLTRQNTTGIFIFYF